MLTTTVPRPRVAPRWLRLLVLAALAAALLSPLAIVRLRWTGRDLAGLTRVTEQFFRGLAEDDSAALTELMPPRAPQAAHQLGVGMGIIRGQYFAFEPGPAAVQGPHARVPFALRKKAFSVSNLPGLTGKQQEAYARAITVTAERLDGKKGALLLRWAEGRWCVFGLELPDGRRLDFERPATVPGGPAGTVKLARLAAVDRAGYERAWRIDRQARDVPARRLVAELAGELKCAWMAGTLPERSRPDWQARPCSFDLKGVSRLQVLEEVARQAGVTPLYQGRLLDFRAGPRPAGVAFAGPFLIRAVRVQESPSDATVFLQLEAVWGDLPAGVERLFPLAVALPETRVIGPGGRDLLHAARQPRMPLPVVSFGQMAWQVPLCALTAELTALERVESAVVVPLPGRVEVGRLPWAGQESSLRVGDVDLALRDAKLATAPGPPGIVRLTASGPVGRVVLWEVIDEQDRVLLQGGSFVPCTHDFRQWPKGATAVQVQVVTITPVRHDFVLRDVPLTGRPPRRLRPPHPAGRAPVTVRASLPSSLRGGAFLSIVNHCPRAIDELRLRLVVRDGAGKELARRDVVYPARGGRMLPRPFVQGWETHPGHLAKDWPDGAARFDVEVRRVLFADGTAWGPPGRK